MTTGIFMRLAALSAVAVAYLFSPCSSALAHDGLGDWDGDGRSDLVYIRVDNSTTDPATSFRYRSSINPDNIVRHRFTVAADAFVMGDFFFDNRTYPGIIKADDATLPLLWIFKDPQGQEISLRFGLPGDQIPNLGDLDCDGRTDLITTRKGTSSRYPGFRIWYVALTGGEGSLVETVFGLATDEIAVADVDGDGCDELIALRPSNFTWFSRGLFEGGDATESVQWGLKGDKPILPRDMNADGKPDYIVTRSFGSQELAIVRYGEGSTGLVSLGSSTEVPLAGKFFGSSESRSTFGWIDRANTHGTLLNLLDKEVEFGFGSTDMTIMRPDGTVVGPGSDGSVGGDDGADPGVCQRRINPVDGRSSGVTYNPDNSRGQPKLIMPSQYNTGVSSVTLYQGTRFIANCKRALPNEHGNRPRWYCAIPVASTPINVNFVLKRNGVNECVPIPNPRQRYD